MLQFSQADIDKLLKGKELEFQARERELQSKLDEQKRKCTEVSTEKLQSDEKVIRLQKSHEDMKYVMIDYSYSVYVLHPSDFTSSQFLFKVTYWLFLPPVV